ncbi:MAG: hypothetical protein M1130_03240 [Actinobacteria bacterium]|nr:hypothetical protein [Actinomycetota bacterium]
MRKLTALAVLVSLLALLLAGCAKKDDTTTKAPPAAATNGSTEKSPVTLKDLSLKEKEFLAELEPLHTKIDAAFKDFNSGKTDRNKLNSELSALKPGIDDLNKKSKEYYGQYKISDEDKNDPIYSDGLKYGSKLRSIISNTVKISTEGQKVVNLQKKDESGNNPLETKNYDDNMLKKYYSDKEKEYQQYLGKLKGALEK